MNIWKENGYAYLALCFLALLLLGCQQTEPDPRLPVNSFSMQINDTFWTPFQFENDPCKSTYSGSYGLLGDRPLYTIFAYRDPNGIDDYRSENLLRINIMDMKSADKYVLDGTYKNDFDSYIIFQVRQSPENFIRYVNDPHRSPFVINVDELIISENTSIPRIKGSFEGVLFNEADPTDSISITKGKFNLTFSGGYHCGFGI